MNQSNRRDFLKQSLAFAGYLAVIPALASCNNKGDKTILLRSSWQVENIGDIGHTPGVLALIEKYLPHVKVRLWPNNVGSGVEEMLMKRFPELKILSRPKKRSGRWRNAISFCMGPVPPW